MSDAPPRWPLGIPSRLRPVEVLGVGGSSVVWRVRDTEIGADLAVKVLDQRTGLHQRIETEARALARLRAVDGVVPLHELGVTEDGAAWMACDLVVGGTLADRSPLGTAELATIGATVAETLAAAHGLDVIHGDVTPTNIVFDGADRPLLADFGLAGLGQAAGDPGGLTPAFAAPERLRGAVPSAASDVFGLGASLSSEAAASARTELSHVLERCCAEHPGRRPTAAALVAALRGSD